jgi:methyl-accepting chemotaxis protein
MKLSNMKIGAKVVGLVVVALLVSSSISAFVLTRLMATDATYTRLLEGEVRARIVTNQLNAAQQEIGRLNYKAIATESPADMEAQYESLTVVMDRIDKTLLPELNTLLAESNGAQLETIASLMATMQQVVPEIRRAAVTGDDGTAMALSSNRFGPAREALAIEVQKIIDSTAAEMTSVSTTAHASARTDTLLSVGAILVTLVVMGGVAFWIGMGSIARPLVHLAGQMRRLAAGDYSVEVDGADRGDEVGDVARTAVVFRENGLERERLERETVANREAQETERRQSQMLSEEAAERQAAVVEALAMGLAGLSQGDLTVQLTQTFPPEYEKLQQDFNGAIGQLREAMAAVVTNVAAIRSGSEEIAQASDDLSRRTEQQAASLEETAAALEQITATVKRTASGSQEAASAVASAKGDAQDSGEVVQRAIAAMGQIQKSSAEISQIIGVIDEIAFQTNLLALNAGVEAARAGDAGRGFAVVAQEVRALAQRSAEAAKEIKGLISTSGQQVSEGVSLVGETGSSLTRIVEQVVAIDGLISEISGSAHEQATSLAEVNTAVNHMDQMVQQNAAMVEQTTAASHALKNEAGELDAMMSRFVVGEAPGAGHSKPVHAARARTEAYGQSPGTGSAARTRPMPRLVGNTAVKADEWEEF